MLLKEHSSVAAAVTRLARSCWLCFVSPQGETKAAPSSGERWPGWNAAAAKDPARGHPASPALAGCPRGAGLGRALCRAAPRMGQRLVRPLSPAKATCCLLQLIISLSEMQRVRVIRSLLFFDDIMAQTYNGVFVQVLVVPQLN